jgi:hypothetical protein
MFGTMFLCGFLEVRSLRLSHRATLSDSKQYHESLGYDTRNDTGHLSPKIIRQGNAILERDQIF